MTTSVKEAKQLNIKVLKTANMEGKSEHIRQTDGHNDLKSRC